MSITPGIVKKAASHRRLRGAIVGFGGIAERAHLPAFQLLGLEVAAVIEPSPARQAVARALLPRTRIYGHLAEALGSVHFDFVDVCTPPHLHFPACEAALRAGKDVLCEKPLILRQEDGERLVQAARRAGRTVVCMHNWTQASAVRRLKQVLMTGGLGQIKRFVWSTLRTQPAPARGEDQNWRISLDHAGGGILMDHGWHALSIMLQLLEQRPRSVQARIYHDRKDVLEVEDGFSVDIGFGRAMTAHVSGTWNADRRENTLEVEGERGTVDIINDRLTLRRPERQPVTEIFPESLAAGGYRPDWTAAQMEVFLHERQTRQTAGLDEALSVAALIQAAYQSAAAGGVSKTLPAAADSRDDDAVVNC